MKKKLKIQQIRVSSFITSLDDMNSLRGGAVKLTLPVHSCLMQCGSLGDTCTIPPSDN